MKNLFFCLFLLSVVLSSYGQTIRIRAGISSSELAWKSFITNSKSLSKGTTGSQLFIGITYLQKKYFDISSDIGYLEKGGRIAFYNWDSVMPNQSVSYHQAKLHYLSFVNTVNLKYPLSPSLTPFVSLGPRIDYVISYNDVLDKYGSQRPKKIAAGLLFGAGIRYKPAVVEFGLRADYLYNFTDIIHQPDMSLGTPGRLNDRTFLISASVGLKI